TWLALSLSIVFCLKDLLLCEFHYKITVSSTSLEKNAEQVRNLVRDLDRYPSSSSGSLPQAWMLHCGVLDLLGPDSLRLCPWHNIRSLRDCVPEQR
uniref:Uncharacterized protein n=1 Tax=Brassica oleracea var. oleracea TaxID=109376 RepID=A0A0D3DH22_BRAOL